MLRKILPFLVILLFTISSAQMLYQIQHPAFSSLDANARHDRIIHERDQAITEAIIDGDYECCINPVCTMCYMDGNKWNYGEAGSCHCDDFIAKGEPACPQCERGLVKDTGKSCELNSLDEICETGLASIQTDI